MPESTAGLTGLVIASYGQRGILADRDDVEHRYILKGRKLRVVCGDHVLWQAAERSGDAVVTDVQERRNALERPNTRGKSELIAANLSQIVVVLAPLPNPIFFWLTATCAQPSLWAQMHLLTGTRQTSPTLFLQK